MEAVKGGRVDEAKAMFADVRIHYERTEPIAGLFNELDPTIDAREDDFKARPQNPDFTGFLRIEYALWIQNSVKGAESVADKLLQDGQKLKQEIDILAFRQIKWWVVR